MSSTAQTVSTPWHTRFPVSSFESRRISSHGLAELMRTKIMGVDYIVIDVRRVDFEKCFVKGALNLPAHSFYPTVSTIATILSSIPVVVFHCNSCSATGRGPRTAGWYSSELSRQGVMTSEAVILDGGIKEFEAVYGDDESLVLKLPDLDQ